LQFAKIPRAEMLPELEFYFPVKKVSSGALHELLGKFGWSAGTPAHLGKLTFDPVNGFLKGFIDLVFRSGNRYYIVDWKSNWLGDRIEAYSQAALRNEMARQDYCLQYHLYTVALDKYLALRLPGYDYERDFGGVLYIFLRGLDPARPDWGVFRDRPSAETVQQLSALLGGEKV
jgi:exodeoxyribonuclease V beta subunit